MYQELAAVSGLLPRCPNTPASAYELSGTKLESLA
jgi:hypothetical protein